MRFLLMFLFLCSGVFANELPDSPLPNSPKPKAVAIQKKPEHQFNKKVFFWETGALAASQIADALSTSHNLQYGGRETNPIYGEHPSAGKLAAVNAAVFAGQVGIFYFTERSHNRVIRWVGRSFIAAATVNHARLAACNYSINPHDPNQGCHSLFY